MRFLVPVALPVLYYATVNLCGRLIDRRQAPLHEAGDGDACTCHIFDMGPRCEACVEKCTAAGHPYTEDAYNGQHHWCGVIL